VTVRVEWDIDRMLEQGDTTVVCARLPKAAVEKLDDIAAMLQMSRSELVKKIVLAFLTAWKRKLDKLAL